MSIADVELIGPGSAAKAAWRSSSFRSKPGVPGVDMEFSWNAYAKGYGTPRHKHTFDQFRFALEGDREIKDGYLQARRLRLLSGRRPVRTADANRSRAPGSACSFRARPAFRTCGTRI